jgi:nucleoside-diphosphate-sugar epimerase
MRKLIFGCGYLGRRVAVAWHAAGDEVHVVTRSVERAAEFQSRGWTPHVADICQPATLTRLPTVDTVVFCVGYDRQSGQSQRDVMVDGLVHVLDHFRNRCERFIYTSSTSVYGQDAGEWVDESSPCDPTQPGGVCCLEAERRTQQRGVVLRLAGIYGPGRLLSRIESLQRGEPLAGRPDVWLNLIHVDDAVAAILAVEQKWSAGETFVVCDDRPIPRSEYFAMLAQLVHAPPPLFDETQPARRGSEGLNKRCSNRKLRQQLGVTLRFPTMNEGLPAAIAAQTTTPGVE